MSNINDLFKWSDEDIKRWEEISKLMQQTQEEIERYYMQRLIYTIGKVLFSKDNNNE